MSNLKFSRKDGLDPSFEQHSEYDDSQLLGTWYNCDPATSQISELNVTRENEDLYIDIKGANVGDTISWGKKKITPFVSIPDSNVIGGFTCHYDFGFMETQICSNIKRGILVIQAYNMFKDGSQRPNYYSREFFNQ